MQGYPLYELSEKMLRKVHDFCEYLTDWDTKREYYINELLPDYIYPYPEALKKLPKEAKEIYDAIYNQSKGKETVHLLDIIVGVKENYEEIKKQKEQKEREQKELIKQNIDSILTAINSGDLELAMNIFEENRFYICTFFPELLHKIAIAKSLRTRKVQKLVHFTNIENLASILKIGLLPRMTLEEQNINFVYSDESRIEGRKDCICLSVEYPNNKMLFKKYNTIGEYVVLVLNAKPILLNDDKKYYLFINAASVPNSLKSDKLTAPIYFENMFQKQVGWGKPDRDEKLPSFVPTCEQAEILLQGSVDINDIQEVHFRNEKDYNDFINSCKDKELIETFLPKFKINKYYFGKREDVEWEQR